MPNPSIPATGEAMPRPDPLDKQTWEIVCEMEMPIWTIHDLLTAIGLIAPELEGDDAVAALQRIVCLAQDAWKVAEEMRGQLFHLNHPRREEFAKERAQ